ncbi:PTS sugar transporter subunit IIB [Enterococcus sp. HMSC066C04]|uniref:PTS sugar transporter subunit IIB n=1 Tax=Enterococcus sp. HMSC066C04 TaxID=1739504 RepID=UPI0008A57544|nr:PTS sugar transporter subunit IIB [Enterococcus sp. HMSC066C04]OFP18267.1 PTS sugar transporter subunit IIB [Enterococcus sp. HMSC066C04]
MVNILLCCNEGMSTSFLVKKMQEVADTNGLKVKIWAVSEPKVDTESKEADIVLLGPQIAFMRDTIAERLGTRIPVQAINAEDFGRLNANKILKETLMLIRENREKQGE